MEMRSGMIDEGCLKTRIVQLIREGRPEKALELLSEKYGVKPPRLRTGTVKGHRNVTGCYVAKEQTIYVSDSKMLSEPHVLLHEFYHHLRWMEGEFSGSERHAGKFAKEFLKL
jgi:hypothetical protein